MDSSTSRGPSFGPDSQIPQMTPWASEAMRELERDIACAVRFDARVMLSGERGAGKKFVAQLIHQRRARGQAPFIIGNCHDVLEWPLPDGASSFPVDRFKPGLLTTADNGTLLIEEIEKIPAPMQRQLAQFLDRDTNEQAHLRLMTATSVDLFARVRDQQFSEDLFYRLNRVHLVIPALRDRPEDIPILFRHYLSCYARAEAPRLSSAALDRVTAYSWPGNVQELKAVAERVALHDLPRSVEPDDLPSHIGQ